MKKGTSGDKIHVIPGNGEDEAERVQVQGQPQHFSKVLS